MTGDSLDSLRDDLVRYLGQLSGRGPDWMLLEAGVAPTREPAIAEAPAPAATADAPKPARDEAFQRECERFVSESLAAIDVTREAPAPTLAQSDIFASSPADAEPGPQPPPAPRTREEKVAALAALAREVSPCTRCKLHTDRTQTVFGAGNPEADLVLIGEAPGRDEDLQGLPFVGRSGQLLTKILAAVDFARDDVYICNILKCRPPNNRDPEAEEVASCEPYLKRQLAILEPRLILCLGRIATQTLLGTSASLGALRRAVHFYGGIPVMATYHPAALLRNEHHKRDTWDDVRKVRALHDALRARS